MGILKHILYLVLPPRCNCCEAVLTDEAGLCYTCWNKIHFISEPLCNKCGYPLEFDLGERGKKGPLCGRCLIEKYYFKTTRSVCSYGQTVGQIIGKLKYGDNPQIAKFIAKSMVPTLMSQYGKIDIICPVPIHSKALRKRMFNQSALIATSLVQSLKKQQIYIKYLPDLLIKIKLTPKQNQLTRAQRLENVKNSFSVNPKYNISEQKILIIDDVITTGATINECARTMIKSDKSCTAHSLSYARTTLGGPDHNTDADS